MNAGFYLQCLSCERTFEADGVRAACETCKGELRVRYQDERKTEAGEGIFHFAGRLPVAHALEAISLGEGNTPLLTLSNKTLASVSGARIHVKCEYRNPTGSFKDRIAAVAATRAKELGLPGLVGTSSGNGGAAISAYGARAGLSVTLFALSDIAPQKLLEIQSLGGQVVLLRGLGHDGDATDRAAETICELARMNGLMPFVTASRFSPQAMEGAKTIAYELAAESPSATAIYVPIGGGGLYSAIWRGYRELRDDIGFKPPRLVAVQPSGCGTIRHLSETGSSILPSRVETSISGLQVGSLFDALGVKTALDESAGHLVEVTDEQVWAAHALLAGEGILTEPAGATALAGAIADAKRDRLDKTDDIIVVATGAGYKDRVALERLAQADPLEEIGADEIDAFLSRTVIRTAGPIHRRGTAE